MKIASLPPKFEAEEVKLNIPIESKEVDLNIPKSKPIKSNSMILPAIIGLGIILVINK